MDELKRKYYHAYEDRYRSVYEQGVRYWSDFPSEIQDDLEGFDELLELFSAQAETTRDALHAADWMAARPRVRVLEPGCGEGRLAVECLARGFDYVGIDLAESALAKATARVGALAATVRARRSCFSQAVLVCRDATDLSFLEPASFDLAIDNKFFHMLVVDGDRRLYLNGLRRALKPGGLVMFNELYRAGAFDGPIETFDDYMREFTPDLVTEEERTAYNDGREVFVRMTQVPARPRDEKGYIHELSEHGFEVVKFQVLKSYMGCRFIARVIQ